jgi:CRP-like cAMP-binding protein
MPETAAQPPSAPVIVCKAGEFLFREGERHGSLFVVERGQVELVRALRSGPERLALLGPGDVAGEDCAFGRRAAGCSARAVSDAAVIRVAADAFQDLLRVRPEIAGHVIAALGRRLLEARVACVIDSAGEGEARPAAAAQPPSAAPSPDAARAPASARLVHEESGRTFALPPAGAVVVGRADPRTTFVPDIELSALDTGRTLSRRHATIARRADDAFSITEEPRVANGTFVNGERLKAGVPGPLRNGDEVCFGLVRTIFRTV